MNADELVDTMLETMHDAHIKAHERVQKWDRAYGSFKELVPLKAKALDLFRQTGTAIAYERALAHVGLTRDDVERTLTGAYLGATDNFKGTEPAYVCQNEGCYSTRLARPRFSDGTCESCGRPLSAKDVPISKSRLQTTYPKHIFGIVTNDGRKVWFSEPVPPPGGH